MTAKVRWVPGVGLMLRTRRGWVGESGRTYEDLRVFAGVCDVAPVVLRSGTDRPNSQYETVTRVAQRCGHNATPERLQASLAEEVELPLR